jgi:hypothetical protein
MMEQRLANRYVAFFDILGFSHLVSNESLLVVAEKISRLIYYANGIMIKWNIYGKPLRTYEARHLHFSDSILLWSPPVPRDYPFSPCVHFSMCVGILIACGMFERIPLRAGVAFGQTYIDIRKRIIIGQPVIDAYRLEKVQEWIGGAFHSSINREDVLRYGHAVQYCVPVKPGTHGNTELAVDWVASQPAQLFSKTEGGRREQVLDWIDENIATASSQVIRDKYANTRTFFEIQSKMWMDAFPSSKIH